MSEGASTNDESCRPEREIADDGSIVTAVDALSQFCARYDLDYAKLVQARLSAVRTCVVLGDDSFLTRSSFTDGPVSFTRVPWLPSMSCFVAEQTQTGLSQLPMYQDGKMFGIESSSVAAMVALDVRSHHRVLDMCCAPGAKLSLLASCQPALLVGCDVSLQRLQVCQNLLSKYKLRDRVVLIHADSGNLKLDRLTAAVSQTYARRAIVALDEEGDVTYTGAKSQLRKLRKLSHGHRVHQKVSGDHPNDSSVEEVAKVTTPVSTDLQLGFDRILVDVECSHDGSVKHADKFSDRFLSDSYMQALVEKQKQCLMTALDLLVRGGYLVYSTCSLTREQNEDVVADVLSRCPSVKVVQVDQVSKDEWPCRQIQDGPCQGALRFEPWTCNSGGLFIAKLYKF